VPNNPYFGLAAFFFAFHLARDATRNNSRVFCGDLAIAMLR
jgi:hypothetical protein